VDRERTPRQAAATADLTTEEQEHVRRAMQFLRVRCGGWAQLATVLRFKRSTTLDAGLGHGAVSASMAFRVARLAAVSVDDLLTGKFPLPGTCPHCGHATEPGPSVAQ
jgi:hypothetical protein